MKRRELGILGILFLSGCNTAIRRNGVKIQKIKGANQHRNPHELQLELLADNRVVYTDEFNLRGSEAEDSERTFYVETDLPERPRAYILEVTLDGGDVSEYDITTLTDDREVTLILDISSTGDLELFLQLR